ncbi:MAG: polysaccharide deacetylase family protein [Terrimicrobiaceae bacterium]|nr:polysaccharide deacetylase family protein [Terrimicrobiaceae bacterium]
MIPVCQCWDDGVASDVRLTDILRRFDAPATFNLCPGTHSASRTSGWKFRGEFPVWKLGLGELVAIYEGFQIANHSMNHPRLTSLSRDEAARDIQDGRDALEQIFQKPITGFVYPFGDFNGEVAGLIADSGHSYARTTGGSDRLPEGDRVSIHPTVHFLSSAFWEEFDRCKAAEQPFYFWGHSYEMVTESQWSGFEETISRICDDPDVRWASVEELAGRLRALQAG